MKHKKTGHRRNPTTVQYVIAGQYYKKQERKNILCLVRKTNVPET